MKVYKSPQVRMDGKRIEYTFDRNKITASFDGVRTFLTYLLSRVPSARKASAQRSHLTRLSALST